MAGRFFCPSLCPLDTTDVYPEVPGGLHLDLLEQG